MKRTRFFFLCLLISILSYGTAFSAVTVIPDQSIANQFTRHTVTGITTMLPQLPDVTGYPGASYLTIGDIDGDESKKLSAHPGLVLMAMLILPGMARLQFSRETAPGLTTGHRLLSTRPLHLPMRPFCGTWIMTVTWISW